MSEILLAPGKGSLPSVPQSGQSGSTSPAAPLAAGQASPAARIQGGGWTPPISGLLGVPSQTTTPNVLAPVTHDVLEWQTVYAATATEPASLTASISAGSPYFQVIQLQSINVTTFWQEVGGGELPAGQSPTAPSKTQQYTVAGNSDGVRPLAVQSGQMVALAVSVEVPHGASLPPGPFTGTAIIRGYRQPVLIDLHCEYLAVDLNSPIGRKWQAMGGESFFGTVLTNAGPAPDGSGTIQTFANGALYQVSAAAGAQPPVYYLSNAVYAKWLSLQGATDGLGAPVWNVLGFPASDTFATMEGGQACDFQAGAIVVRKSGQAWVVYGGIYGHYTQFGNLADLHNQPWIGLPASDEEPVDPLDLQPPAQRVSHFDGGDIYWSAATGTHELHGLILQEWNKGFFGAPDIGLPTTDETSTPDNLGRFNRFQGGGAIYWTSGTGAHALIHPFIDRWDHLGGVNSYLGYPTSDLSPWKSPSGQSGSIMSFQYGRLGATPDGIVHEMPATISFKAGGSPNADFGHLNYSGTLTISSNGDWEFSTWAYGDAFNGYDFQINATLTSDDDSVWLGFAHSGNVSGWSSTGGSRTDNHSEQGKHDWIAQNWATYASAKLTLNVAVDAKANGVAGFLVAQMNDVIKAVVATFEGLAVGAPGIGVLVLLGEEVTQASLGISGAIGVIAGVAVFALTDSPILAVAAGIAAGQVSASNYTLRPINTDEYEFAQSIFHDTLPPMNQIHLTNLIGFNGNPFTVPWPNGDHVDIYMNMGPACDSPLTYTKPPSSDRYRHPGEIFVHEMTHTWQIHNDPSLPIFMCDAVLTHTGGGDPYQYGPADTAWGQFNVEAQAQLVNEWYGRAYDVAAAALAAAHKPPNPDTTDPSFGTADPYFHYIRDVIRAGGPESVSG